MVDDVLRRPGDGLDRFGERLRQHIENHFTEVDAEGNRRSLDEHGIAAKLQELQRSGLPPEHDGELAGADHWGTEPTPDGQAHDPSSGPRDQPTADRTDADALSGADIRPRDDVRAWYEWGPRAYDAFRADPTDVADIAA